MLAVVGGIACAVVIFLAVVGLWSTITNMLPELESGVVNFCEQMGKWCNFLFGNGFVQNYARIALLISLAYISSKLVIKIVEMIQNALASG